MAKLFNRLDVDNDKRVTYDEIMERGMHQREREDLVMGIAWIGHTLDPDFEPHSQIIKEVIDYQAP